MTALTTLQRALLRAPATCSLIFRDGAYFSGGMRLLDDEAAEVTELLAAGLMVSDGTRITRTDAGREALS